MRRLRAEAERRHVPIAEVVRDAVDRVVPADPGNRQALMDRLLAASGRARSCTIGLPEERVMPVREPAAGDLEPIETATRKYLKYERIFHPLRFLNLLPLSHVFGQFLGLFIPQLLGATVVFQESLSPSEIVRTIHRERVSVLVGVPRVLDSLRGKIDHDLEAAGGLDRFRREFAAAEGEHFLKRWWRFRAIHRQLGWKFWAFISGGAALAPETEVFWSRLGYAVIQGYGLTETTSLVSVNHPVHIGKGSVGKVLPGLEVKLDPNGEILVRGENVAVGYWQGQAIQPAAGSGDGWFRTGDIGALDTEGNLYFKRRRKNVIVTSAGMNVYPEDLEAVLRRQPEVRDCVVVGLERAGNSEPCAVLILPGPASDPAAIVQRANAALAEYQRMRHWVVWPEQDFPRTSTGKPRTNLIVGTVQAQIAVPVPAGAEARIERGGLSELIARIAGRQPGAPQPAARLETDLHLNSLDRVELLSAIEDRFQVDVNETQFTAAKTVAELERLLRQTPAHGTGSYFPRWAQRWPVPWVRLEV